MIGRLARKLLLAAASFAAAFPAHAEVQWLRSGAPLPDGFDYITVGTEANNVNAGTTLFVCRAAFQHGVYPGKVIGGKCDIGSGGREYTLSPYEMAAAGRGSYYWGRPGEAATPIVGGREGGRPLIICRAEHRSSPDGRTFVSHGMHSGRVIGSNCHIGYGGLEFIKSDYEVLYQSTTQAAAPARPAAPPALAPAPAQPAVVSSTEFGHRVALVIGNGDYRVANRLSNPTNDANDMAAVLRRLGFDVVEGKNLDRRAMDDAIREFGRKLDGADLALFFYAGHGLQVGGKNYLVPIDAKLERAGDLLLDTVDVGTVLAQMEGEKRVNLVFLDACRDNPLSRSLARSLATRSTSVGVGLAPIQSAVGTMIAYATRPESVAFDGEGRNSPFTTALLKHIATPGVDIGALMRRVRADVIAATREKQVPWDDSSLVGDVVLAR
jgi:hypothetical protein